MTSGADAVDWLSASLGSGSSIHAVHPTIAMAGSTRSRAWEPPNDHPVIRMTTPSTGGRRDWRAAHKKSPTERYAVRLVSRLPLHGSAAYASITERLNGFTQARQYCGGSWA